MITINSTADKRAKSDGVPRWGCLLRVRPLTPTRCVQRLSPAVEHDEMSPIAGLSRGRIALPPLHDVSKTRLRHEGGDPVDHATWARFVADLQRSPPPATKAWPSSRRGGRAMRPRLRSAIADLAANATADLSRWTHRVGVMDCTRDRHPHLGTPSDLARRSASTLGGVIGELSPWRSVLPPRCAEGDAFDPGGGTSRQLCRHLISRARRP